ncbi:MAG TPA: alpha/beta hydrolase [Dermatophilaceae bacterium]|nr:alpha/beta hydrolase [Dermatophilaceae bacterium]
MTLEPRGDVPADVTQPWVCAACGNSYPGSGRPPQVCPICADERQWVSPDGQRWTTLETHRLPFLEVPVCVLIGSGDVAGGGAHLPASHELAERIDGSELKVIDGVSHGFFWQKPEEATAELKTGWGAIDYEAKPEMHGQADSARGPPRPNGRARPALKRLVQPPPVSHGLKVGRCSRAPGAT